MAKNIRIEIPFLIPKEQSDLEKTDTFTSFSGSILPSPGIACRRFFFIYRCLPSKTHASHHYKIADYSRSRRGAGFLPVRLDRLERGIENGSE